MRHVSTAVVFLAATLTAATTWAACPGDCPVPGFGSKTTECFVEYDGVVLNFPPTKPKQVRCTDGDACDADGLINGSCQFVLSACLNNTDPNFPDCVPSDIATFEVKNKDPLHPRFDPELQVLADAVGALGLPTSASVCAAPVTMTVPLRVKKGVFRKDKKRVVSKAFTSGGQKDADKIKLFCEPSPAFPAPGQGFARAVTITTEGQRIGGPLGRSDIGDYLMWNDKIQVAILRPGRHAYNAVGIYGGNIIDADLHRSDGSERDSFEVMATGVNLETTANYTSVTVLNDGTNGMPAVIRATGPDDLLDFINPSTTIADFGFTFPPSADDVDLPIDIQTDYILEAGTNYVRVETTVTNTGVPALDIFMGEYINGSGEIELFQPVYGFGEPLVTTSCNASSYLACTVDGGPTTCDRCNYNAYSGEDGASGVSYGLIHSYNGTTSFSVSGVNVPLYSRESVSTLIGVAGPNFHIEPTGMAGDSITVTRYFAIGDGTVASITSTRNEIFAFSNGTIQGTVTSGGQPVADADVAVRTAPFGNFAGALTYNVINHFRTAADGTYAGTLPPGDYTLDVNKDGRLAGAPTGAPVTVTAGATSTQDLTLPAPGILRVTVTDENSDPIAAKLQVVGFDPSPPVNNTQSILGLINNTTGVFGDEGGSKDGLVHGIASVAFIDRDGDSGDVEVEPGTYQVVVSHGTRYSIATQNVAISAGVTTNVALEIAQVVPTPGYISGDWHVHSIDSADSEVTTAERVATEVAEGMDFFTPSDHEVRVDFTSVIADLGVSDLIATAPSEEITTFDYGHFNSWPVTVDPGQLSGGGVDHGRAGVAAGQDFPSLGNYGLSPAEIFAAAHADPKSNLIQINHMDSFFNTAGLDIDTAEGDTGPPQSHQDVNTRRLDPAITNAWDPGFDALEVWIGTNGRNGIVGDFFGQNLGDWVNLINQGFFHTGVASSDTHQRRTTQINARSYVASAVTDPGLLAAQAETLAMNVVEGRVVGTNGPFVEFSVDAASTAQTAGLAIGEPTLIATNDGEVDVTVSVKSPLWAEFDTIELLVNNAPQRYDNDSDAGTRDRYRVIADFSQSAPGDFTISTVNDFPLITGASHFEATATFNLTGLTSDVWILAIVRGTDGVSQPHFPAYPNSLDTGSNTTLGDLTDGNLGEGGMTSLAFTNPLYVDVDGGGWTAPGVLITP
jgi:hypothetical protein